MTANLNSDNSKSISRKTKALGLMRSQILIVFFLMKHSKNRCCIHKKTKSKTLKSIGFIAASTGFTTRF